MDIKELALKVAKEMNWRMDEMTLETFATRLIAAYCEGQEPVGKVLRNGAGQVWIIWEGETDIIDYVGQQLFTAPPEPAQNLYREIYEVWAGSEGIPMPRTAPEAYLLGLLEQMVDIAKTGMHMTEPAPQQLHPTHEANFAAQVVLGAAPSSGEVGQMVEQLRTGIAWERAKANSAADLIERLAARVPDGCVVVPKDLIDAAKNLLAVKGRHHTELAYKQLCQALIAAGEVK